MVAVIAKWGNGHAVRLSKDLMSRAGITPLDKLNISVEKDSIILTKVRSTKAEKFMQVFGDYKGKWKCAEIDVGDAVGKEVLE